MTFKQILDSEENNLDRIVLYTEGIFWKAYEHSAFLFCSQQVPLKPTVKSLKYLGGQNIISVGFPKSGESRFLAGLETLSRSEKMIVLKSKEPVLLQEFEEWKSAFHVIVKEDKRAGRDVVAPVLCARTETLEKKICSRIRSFNIASSTPLECMSFLSELQNLLLSE